MLLSIKLFWFWGLIILKDSFGFDSIEFDSRFKLELKKVITHSFLDHSALLFSINCILFCKQLPSFDSRFLKFETYKFSIDLPLCVVPMW